MQYKHIIHKRLNHGSQISIIQAVNNNNIHVLTVRNAYFIRFVPPSPHTILAKNIIGSGNIYNQPESPDKS